ncbi:hypothetical protein [Sphingomonas phyllosphaerae]|uniref:hypothetical protein n=1 Tax=Sphingomonas phyllosphaerae TaxID=257003 RepID=UPI000423EAD2|nr:hypothetical protein [Sphingomonas phyllosphaerae]
MLIAHELTGMRVLIAHEDNFQREYLSKVMIAAGAIVVDAPTTTDGVPWLGDPFPDAVVVSQSRKAADDGRLIDAARRGALAMLVLHSAPTLVLPSTGLLRSLEAPYAAFQVVSALRDMLRRPLNRPMQL